jgi:hypothetical protein
VAGRTAVRPYIPVWDAETNGLRLLPLSEFQQHHFGGVALARPRRQDARISAGAALK